MSYADIDIIERTTAAAWRIYIPVLIFVGTIGNCLSVCVCFGTSKMRRSSSSYYLAALAIADEGNLICCLMHSFSQWFGTPIYRGYVCQLMAYFSTFCNLLSAWFVVAFTIERFVAVCYPLRRHTVCTVTRAKKIIVGLTALGSVLCSPVFYILTPTCVIVEQLRGWVVGFGIFNSIVADVIPFTAIAVLNVLIVKALRRHAGVRQTLTNDNMTSRNDDLSSVHKNSTVLHAKTTKMLLIVSSVFLCLNLPFEVGRLYTFIKPEEELSETAGLIRFITTILFVTSFGINFFLYCASGRDFRQAALDMIICRSRTSKASKSSLFVQKNHFHNALKSVVSAADSSTSQRTISVFDLSTNTSSELRDLSNDAKKH